MANRNGMSIGSFLILALFFIVPAVSQEILEYEPEDAVLISIDLRDYDDTYTMKLAPGLYEMGVQLRFQDETPVLEGSGSGLGPEATILDFYSYSASEDDARAFSIRGPAIIRNITILNADGRALDLRTGSVDSPSDAPVIFENVWFINCQTIFKSTGGRTVGTPAAPMIVKNCVFAITADYPSDFGAPSSIINLRDTSYATFDHCDFFNHDLAVSMRLDDPEAAPNEGPSVTITNSILLATNGNDGTVETDDIYLTQGSLTIKNSVLWDLVSEGELLVTGGAEPEIIDSVVYNPLYVNVTPGTLNADLDFNLQSGSPASGLGLDGLNAGSIAGEPVSVYHWSLF